MNETRAANLSPAEFERTLHLKVGVNERRRDSSAMILPRDHISDGALSSPAYKERRPSLDPKFPQRACLSLLAWRHGNTILRGKET